MSFPTWARGFLGLLGHLRLAKLTKSTTATRRPIETQATAPQQETSPIETMEHAPEMDTTIAPAPSVEMQLGDLTDATMQAATTEPPPSTVVQIQDTTMQDAAVEGSNIEVQTQDTIMQDTTVEESSTEVQNQETSTEQPPEPAPPTGPPTKCCTLCLEDFEDDETTAARFPFTCEQCDSNGYCIKCIKQWFLDACKNESKMPPRCCVALPLSVVAEHLSIAEVCFYR